VKVDDAPLFLSFLFDRASVIDAFQTSFPFSLLESLNGKGQMDKRILDLLAALYLVLRGATPPFGFVCSERQRAVLLPLSIKSLCFLLFFFSFLFRFAHCKMGYTNLFLLTSG